MPDSDNFESPQARDFVREIINNEAEVIEFVDQKRELIIDWKHDKEYGMSKAVAGFFFGTEWMEPSMSTVSLLSQSKISLSHSSNLFRLFRPSF